MVTGKPFLTVDQIQGKVKELADRISDDYAGKNLLAVCILKGAFMFFADIVRLIKVPMRVDFMAASSYIKTESSQEIKIHCDIREKIEDKDILLIEDIADTGVTLNYIRERILARSPKSLKICTFLDKQCKRVTPVLLDYVGFEIPDVFVVGYGLDYDNHFRNLPYISIFKKTDNIK